MQLRYGSYSFDAGACKLATSSETAWNEGGQPISQKRRIDVDGFLSGNGQAAISVLMSALATALARPYQDLNFYHDDGSLSATALNNAASITGVRIVAGPNFPDWKGNEFGQFRRFTFSAEAEYPLTNTQNLLAMFRERMTFSGGGPIYGFKMALNGPPQRQLIYPFSVFRATQEGEAIGYRAYPTPPVPRWPNNLKQSPNQSLDAPRRAGKIPASYQNYPVSWQYEFESASQLSGFPNLWLG